MELTNILTNKKQPNKSDGQKPRVRGWEEMMQNKVRGMSCCSRLALARGRTNMLRKAVGRIRVYIWPQLMRRKFVIAQS